MLSLNITLCLRNSTVPVPGQIYYASPMYSQSVQQHPVHAAYSAYNTTHHPAHQPDSRFVPQSHPVLSNQDSNPPATNSLATPTQQNTCTSVKPEDEQVNGNDKKSEHSDTSNDDSKVKPLVKKTSKHNVKSAINKNCKIEENNVVADVNIEVNVEITQNGETQNKDDQETISTHTTTIVSESTITKRDEIVVKIQESVALKEDQAENAIKTPTDSSATS
ncbi:PREDICTED: uncharacterized protein LOC106748303, partial [Dinoponera quadriceps]|uniref:Uncharacterized protein LOC106748303 n=1 Tax=Dinoponera quadriceps TaxID=609295 RepID=A0A6P3XW92_DINQU